MLPIVHRMLRMGFVDGINVSTSFLDLAYPQNVCALSRRRKFYFENISHHASRKIIREHSSLDHLLQNKMYCLCPQYYRSLDILGHIYIGNIDTLSICERSQQLLALNNTCEQHLHARRRMSPTSRINYDFAFLTAT